MSIDSTQRKFDLFLAHASADAEAARGLYQRLVSKGHTVFLDAKWLDPGDWWDAKLPDAQCASRVTVALVSGARGYHDLNEYQCGIELARETRGRHRVVPVYLEGKRPSVRDLPAGFLRLEPICPKQPWDLDSVADQLSQLLRKLDAEARPDHTDARIKELTERLESVQMRLDTQQFEDRTPDALMQEIRELQRVLRSGDRLQPGDLLSGRYRLNSIIRQGRFGVTWKGYDRREEGLVAVKVLHNHLVDDQSCRDRFFQGVRKMAELEHPGIATVVEKGGQEGRFHYFVTELLDGGDLQTAVEDGRVTHEDAVPLVLEVGRALQAAHDAELVHGKLKPANILLSAAGGPKLTGFDVVRADDSAGGAHVGRLRTVAFAAPELKTQAETAGPSADVYGLAMIAVYVLSAGKLSNAAIIDRPEKVVAELTCSEATKRVLLKGIASEERARYPSAKKFCDALRRADERSGSRMVLVALVVLAAMLTVVLAVFGPHVFGTGDPVVEPRPLPPPPDAESSDTPKGQDTTGFVRIDPGRFSMGSPKNEDGRDRDEHPQHPVTISRAFYLQTTEVTQAAWRALMGNNPSSFKSCGETCPVERVSWWDALAYANKLSEKDGLPPCYELKKCKNTPGTGEDNSGHFRCSDVEFHGLQCAGYRLPTEAEWEYAARAGTEGPAYAAPGDCAWHEANAQRPWPVAGKQPNDWGLHDMLGNVWEWVWDEKGGYAKGERRDPTGPVKRKSRRTAGNSLRVFRGGSWDTKARFLRVANRKHSLPHARSRVLGFRLARTVP